MIRILKLIPILKRANHNYGTPRKSENYYEILKVPCDASKQDIRLAFLKLCKEFHPDRSTKTETSHDEFVKINDAYNVLSKDDSRRQYDMNLYHNRNPYKSIVWPINERVHHSYGDSIWHERRGRQYRGRYKFSHEHYYTNKDQIRRSRSVIPFIIFLLCILSGVVQVSFIYQNNVCHDNDRNKMKQYKEFGTFYTQTETDNAQHITDIFQGQFDDDFHDDYESNETEGKGKRM